MSSVTFHHNVAEVRLVQAYQASLELADVVFATCAKLRISLQGTLGNQCRRAVLSIPNQLAEAQSTWSDAEQQRHYASALRAARACATLTIVLYRRQAMVLDDYVKLRMDIQAMTHTLQEIVGDRQ